jgi:hypothetical protein
VWDENLRWGGVGLQAKPNQRGRYIEKAVVEYGKTAVADLNKWAQSTREPR